MVRAALIAAICASPAAATEAPQITVINRASQDIAAMTVFYVDDVGNAQNDAVGSAKGRLHPGESTVVTLTGLTMCRPVYVFAFDRAAGFAAEAWADACDPAPVELRDQEPELAE